MSRELEEAKLQSERARRRLAETIAELQDKAGDLEQDLKPATLANKAWNGVREKGGEIADEAVEAVRARPLAAGGAVAAFFLFLARGRIASAASRLWSKDAGENGKEMD